MTLLLCAGLILAFSGCAKKNPEEKLQQAEIKMRNNDLIGARIELKELLEENREGPVATQARFLLGQAYFYERDFESARQYLNQALKEFGLQDDRGRLSLDMILNTYAVEKRFEEGIAKAKEIMEPLPPENDIGFRVKTQIADLLAMDGRTTESLQYVQKLVQEGVTHQQRTYALEKVVYLMVSQQKYEEAVEAYEDYLEKYPDYEDKNDLLAGIGYFYSKQGQEEKGEEYFQQAREGYDEAMEETLDKNRKAELMYRKGKSYELSGEFEQARDVYNKIVQEFPESELRTQAIFAAGDSYVMQDKRKEALEYFQEAQQKFAQNPQIVQGVRRRLGRLMQLRQGDQATTPGAAMQRPPAGRQPRPGM